MTDSPSAMFIDAAADTIQAQQQAPVTTLYELQFSRAEETLPDWRPERVTDFEAGYLLGLETARIVRAGTPEIKS